MALRLVNPVLPSSCCCCSCSSSSSSSSSGAATRSGRGSETKAIVMATSSFRITARLRSSSALGKECSADTHRESTGGGVLGFINVRSALGRRKADARAAAAALSGSSSRFPSRAVAVSATKTTKQRNSIADDDGDFDDEATEFEDMEDWMNNKPSGFGMKEYDTTLEDRLLEEIKADENAQAAASAKKKNAAEPGKKSSKATEKQDTPPEGVEVYVGNLPKKRNVDRDLRAAVRSAQGLLHIRPVVGGNVKTREPICKGLAFLTFASDNHAQGFIKRYNGETIKFGKTEKKLTCELASPNSPFKKQLSQKQGMGVPRLSIREISPAASSTTSSVVELVDTTHSSVVESSFSDMPPPLDLDYIEEQDEDIDSLKISEDEDVDSLEASEDDLLQLEQEIWAELEDEDDFDLDRELEEDNSEDPNVPLNVDKGRANTLDDRAQSSQDLEQIDGQAPHVIHVHRAENGVVAKDKDEETDNQEAGSGRGFGLAHNNKHNATAGDKDKRIQELESKLKKLQLQLKKTNAVEFTKEKELTVQSKEEHIEALEKRVLSRARAALVKDPKLKNSKRPTASRKATISKVKGLSNENASQPKVKSLGAASRLRKRERKIYTEALSKYSLSTKEVAL